MSRYNTINFEKHKIIIIIDNNNNIWFNAKQICTSLNYKQAKRTITKTVEKSDKIQLKNMNIGFEIKQQPDSIYINESGLYSLLISSKNKKSKKFIKWITNDVLPKLREQKIFSPDKEITKLLTKINELESKNKLLQNDLKIEKFPDGAMVYITEEPDIDGDIYYKLGKTDDMNKRIKIHNTHSIHNKKVVHYVELLCPLQLETCIRSMLYKYRYKNKKDYFKCSFTKVIKAFDKCMESIKCVESQEGGGNISYKIMYYANKLKELNDIINLSNII
jgi:prophage antirepressor-like protein/predicted GIY-YIG superfamily endonuclease